ncbi:sortase, partial [Streptomyces sp. NPDC058612]
MTRMPFLASRTMPAALAGAALAVLLAAPSAPAFPSGSASAPARAAALVQTASLSIPAIGVSGLPVIPYPGTPHPAPGPPQHEPGGGAPPERRRGG